MALERQPFNLDVLKQLTDELMAPISAYRHQRSKIAMPALHDNREAFSSWYAFREADRKV